MNTKRMLAMMTGFLFLWIACAATAEEEKKVKEQTLEQKVQRSLDYMEIQNVIAKHSYYYAAQEQWLELETAWAKKRDDISYGHNHGYYYGREAVRNYYGQKNEDRRKQTLAMMSKINPEIENVPENEGIGDMVIHTLTTPFIEIAKDGLTAKGVWMSVGLAAGVRNEGKAQYNWFWEKFGVDFVKEDGEWKIWHFQIYSDTGFSENMGTGMAGPPGGNQAAGAPGEKTADPAAQEAGPPKGMQSDMNRLVQMYEMYSATRVPRNVPELPAPFDTWDDTTPFIK